MTAMFPVYQPFELPPQIQRPAGEKRIRTGDGGDDDGPEQEETISDEEAD